VEMAALWALLFMVSFLNLCKVQIFSDSKIVVDWVNRKSDIQVVCLAAHKAQVR
jgi:ribonuclease HI